MSPHAYPCLLTSVPRKGASRPVWLCVALVTTVLLFDAERSEAKFIPIIWGTGESVAHVGEVPEGVNTPLKQVGFKYWSFSVYWVDLWTSEGAYCLYEGDRYIPLTHAQAAQLLGSSSGEKWNPWWYSFPPSWMAVLAFGCIGFVLSHMKRRAANREIARIQDLFHQEAYVEALQKIQNDMQAETAAEPEGQNESEGEALSRTLSDQERFQQAYERAIEGLVARGIPREEAATNLATIVQIVAAQSSSGS